MTQRGQFRMAFDTIIAYGQDLKYPPKPHREIDGSTLVLIEVWPTVQMR
jgi:hypothetical protein